MNEQMDEKWEEMKDKLPISQININSIIVVYGRACVDW